MTRDITSLPALSAHERVSYGADPNQFFELWRPAGTPIGTAVMIHGGFWRAQYDLLHTTHLCSALARSGILAANLEYRRVGHPGGGWPGTFDDVISGVTAAAAHLCSAPVVMGHSAGGHLALRLAADISNNEELPLRSVLALAPVADLRLAYKLNLSNGAVAEFLGSTPDSRPDLYADACPSHHPGSVRRTLIHGTDDDTVPISISRAFVKAREHHPLPPTLIEIPRCGHLDLIDPESTAWPFVLENILRLLQA